MNKILGLLLLFSLFFSGCGPLPSVSSPLTLRRCMVAHGTLEAECGELLVPEDRANPDGRSLHLGIVVVRARKAEYEPDPLFYIAGGPGNAATSPDIVYAVNNLFWEVNARRDIVFLDQRGTNGEHRLACELIPDGAFDDPQRMNDWMGKCLASLDADPRFYTTAAAMRDLDEARAALGYDKINLFGISYGVAAEQVYMRMFPEHVRAVVMDHGTALDLPFFYVKPRASQYALDQVFAYCEEDEKCHAAYPDIRGDWKKILDRLAEGPVVTTYIAPGQDTPVSVTLEGLADAMHQLMYKSGTYVQIPSLIHVLSTNEDWTPIVESYAEQQRLSSNGDGDNRILLMPHVIFCFEPAWGIQPEQVDRFSPGSYYSDLVLEWAQNEQKLCAALPKPDPSLIYGPGTPAPLSALMFNSLIDPQNPPFHMDLALKEFTKSRLVVEPTEGHDTSASRCRWSIVAQYIEQGSVDGLDTSCMENQTPSFMIR